MRGVEMLQGINRNDERTAYALLRAVVGMNLLMHGISRWMAGPAVFAAKLVDQFAKTPLPEWSIRAFALILPTAEALIGLLLLLGLRTRAALIGANLLMLVLTFGTALVQDWSITGLQLFYSFVYSTLLFLHRYNGWSLDLFWESPGRESTS
jgi:thiosulfate dehydrogenase (quinone) large subunit